MVDELPQRQTTSAGTEQAQRPAAVLVPVLRDSEDELRLVLVVRAAHGVHGGQLALPGGTAELCDGSMLDTAIREAGEEIGLAELDIEVLAALDPMPTRTTGFQVFPFVARIPARTRWRLHPEEIADILAPTVRAIADPQHKHQRVMSSPCWPEPQMIDCVEVDGHLLWGFHAACSRRGGPASARRRMADLTDNVHSAGCGFLARLGATRDGSFGCLG